MIIDFVNQLLSRFPDLIISIVGGMIGTLLIIIFSPVYRVVTKIRGLWIKFRKDPNLSIEVSVGSYLKSSISSEEFNKKIKSALLNVVPTLEEGAGFLRFVKKMDNYDIKGSIFPVTTQEDDMENYGSFTIIISTQNLRLKKLREGLLNIQNFIFRDLFINISRVLIIDVDINNEGITVNLSKPPQVLQDIKDLKISAIVACEDGLSVTFSKDKLKALGKFDLSDFDKIESIVKSNILAQYT